ncbi:MAG: prepilin-type N-terminal cleavage/methylation domain-containing protein [Desulfobacteraceae bacterium]
MSSHNHNGSGFTLMEVLVALAVLAIALTSIYKLQGRTILMSSKARFLTIAPQLAQSKLAEIERREFDDISDGEGVFGEEYPSYSWTLSVEEIPTELITEKDYHLVRIDVRVARDDDEDYQLHTYRFYTD